MVSNDSEKEFHAYSNKLSVLFFKTGQDIGVWSWDPEKAYNLIKYTVWHGRESDQKGLIIVACKMLFSVWRNIT